MTIKIDDQQLIGEIQKKFSETFPFLRLAFFRPIPNLNFLALYDEIPLTERLGKFLKAGKKGKFTISHLDKVSAVEQKFRDLFKLEVQVMRRSGNKWLMTSATDDYTLKQQNSLGIEMATTVLNPEPEDIHEQQ